MALTNQQAKGLIFTCIVLLSLAVDISDAAKSRKAKRPKTAKKDVSQRGLIDTKPGASSIIHEHDKYCGKVEKKNFPGTTLAFVTPWNNHGYEVAKLFNRKLTYVSPTWYRIQPANEQRSYTLLGQHDVDLPWIQDVRSSNNNTSRFPRIVPRFMFEGWNAESMTTFFSDTGPTALARTILAECRQNVYDGIVLDLGAVGVRLPDKNAEKALFAFVKSLGGQLHQASSDFILVAPASIKPVGTPPLPRESVPFHMEDFRELHPFVGKFSVMTYDYSQSNGRPGPNAPLLWSKESAVSLIPPELADEPSIVQKLLMGIPLYGYQYSEEPDGSYRVNAVLGPSFVGLLKEHHPQLMWDESVHEHQFSYVADQRQHTVYYPSLKFLDSRLKVAKDAGIGVAIWELGQGLDYFYDLI